MPTDIPQHNVLVKNLILLSYKVGDKLRLLRDGCNDLVEVISIQNGEELNVDKFWILHSNGHKEEVTHKIFQEPSDIDVDIIPISIEQVKQ